MAGFLCFVQTNELWQTSRVDPDGCQGFWFWHVTKALDLKQILSLILLCCFLQECRLCCSFWFLVTSPAQYTNTRERDIISHYIGFNFIQWEKWRLVIQRLYTVYAKHRRSQSRWRWQTGEWNNAGCEMIRGEGEVCEASEINTVLLVSWLFGINETSVLSTSSGSHFSCHSVPGEWRLMAVRSFLCLVSHSEGVSWC